MPDPNPSPQKLHSADNIDYSNPGYSATPSFPSARQKIQDILKTQPSIPFPDFIDIALYDHDCGYYAKHANQVGRSGDFFTSVSAGPLFGILLSIRFSDWWNSNKKPSRWRILEMGAHDGQLALDILTAIQSNNPDALNGLEYTIPEPLPTLRAVQSKLLADFSKIINIVPSLEELEPMPGIAFGNELLDALPFHLVKKFSNSWKELHLTPDWQLTAFDIPPESELAAAILSLPDNLPEHYQTEIRTNYLPLLRAISSTLTTGNILFFDYGFASPEYYHPYRMNGTLRTYSKHKAAENPVHFPGEIDITAHVDFTALALAASQIGYHPLLFTNQGSYLTSLAKPLIQSGQLSNPKLIANFQTLTHPSHLGASFHAIEFAKNASSPPEVIHRLAIS